eukprot:m51a1_g6037 hypothetical protein (379) ;mRNA; r:154783-156232
MQQRRASICTSTPSLEISGVAIRPVSAHHEASSVGQWISALAASESDAAEKPQTPADDFEALLLSIAAGTDNIQPVAPPAEPPPARPASAVDVSSPRRPRRLPKLASSASATSARSPKLPRVATPAMHARMHQLTACTLIVKEAPPVLAVIADGATVPIDKTGAFCGFTGVPYGRHLIEIVLRSGDRTSMCAEVKRGFEQVHYKFVGTLLVHELRRPGSAPSEHPVNMDLLKPYPCERHLQIAAEIRELSPRQPSDRVKWELRRLDEIFERLIVDAQSPDLQYYYFLLLHNILQDKNTLFLSLFFLQELGDILARHLCVLPGIGKELAANVVFLDFLEELKRRPSHLTQRLFAVLHFNLPSFSEVENFGACNAPHRNT